jgi:hypothetical protein
MILARRLPASVKKRLADTLVAKILPTVSSFFTFSTSTCQRSVNALAKNVRIETPAATRRKNQGEKWVIL